MTTGTKEVRDVRIRMGRDDLALLQELELAYGTTSAEAIRRALLGEVERVREGRMAHRLDTLRTLVLDLRDRMDQVGKRVENSIEVDRGIEKSLATKLDSIHVISVESMIGVKAMIETSGRRDEAKKAIESIRKDLEE